jgi:hypothetical protein
MEMQVRYINLDPCWTVLLDYTPDTVSKGNADSWTVVSPYEIS